MDFFFYKKFKNFFEILNFKFEIKFHSDKCFCNIENLFCKKLEFPNKFINRKHNLILINFICSKQ